MTGFGNVKLSLGASFCKFCNQEVPGSNPPPCHKMELRLVVPNSTSLLLVNSQLVSLQPGWDF